MKKRLSQLVLKYARRMVSRWIVFSIDISLVVLSFTVAYLLRFNFEIAHLYTDAFRLQLLLFTVVSAASFLVFKPYRGIIRQTSMHDAATVVLSVALAVLVLSALSTLLRFTAPGSQFMFPTSILLISFLVSLFFLLFLRFSIKVFYISMVRTRAVMGNVLIFGAGELGQTTKEIVESNPRHGLKVVGFIDDNSSKVGKSLAGVPVYSDKVLEEGFLEEKNIIQLILAVQNISPSRRQQVIERAIDLDLQMLTVPRVGDWNKGQFTYKQIRKVRFEELMGRESIKLQNDVVRSMIEGQVVMVTGAAGSIGSELARQLNQMNPGCLVLVDQAETPLFHLEQSFLAKEKGLGVPKHYILSDISQECCLKDIFHTFRPDIVYHAAAYKHVPMVEKNPVQAVRINIFGTQSLLKVAAVHKVKKVILVSTDKAVNPTSIMGATKRVAEILMQGMQGAHGRSTQFITTRFGNVLGSNGSAIPTFEKQIAEGGPVTVTHPDIMRYFMTIPEACELVLEASAMGRGGEVFVFDMGEQLRIADIARKMIKLSGLEPGKDIEIVYTGLRPGEKLYEELFSTGEENLPTHHPKILIARLSDYPFFRLSSGLQQLKQHILHHNIDGLVETIRELVPEYDESILPHTNGNGDRACLCGKAVCS